MSFRSFPFFCLSTYSFFPPNVLDKFSWVLFDVKYFSRFYKRNLISTQFLKEEHSKRQVFQFVIIISQSLLFCFNPSLLNELFSPDAFPICQQIILLTHLKQPESVPTQQISPHNTLFEYVYPVYHIASKKSRQVQQKLPSILSKTIQFLLELPSFYCGFIHEFAVLTITDSAYQETPLLLLLLPTPPPLWADTIDFTWESALVQTILEFPENFLPEVLQLTYHLSRVFMLF